LEASEDVVEEEVEKLLRDHQEALRDRDKHVGLVEREALRLDECNQELTREARPTEERVVDVERMLDRIMFRYGADAGATGWQGASQFTITDLSRCNLPKFFATRMLEAVNSFITTLELDFRVRNAELQHEAVDGIECNEGLATYAILQL